MLNRAAARLWALVRREPAVFAGLIDALIVLAVTFGAHIDPTQKGAIDAVLAILAGIIIRSQVTPTSAGTPSA